MVGLQTLDLAILVRVQASQPNLGLVPRRIPLESPNLIEGKPCQAAFVGHPFPEEPLVYTDLVARNLACTDLLFV